MQTTYYLPIGYRSIKSLFKLKLDYTLIVKSDEFIFWYFGTITPPTHFFF